MKKALEGIVGAWRTVASWLAGWGADRWMHLVTGLVMAFAIGCVASGERWEGGLVGLLVTQRHLMEVDGLASVEDALGYDYRDGYPERLEFEA